MGCEMRGRSSEYRQFGALFLFLELCSEMLSVKIKLNF